jgi:hypothetical protein
MLIAFALLLWMLFRRRLRRLRRLRRDVREVLDWAALFAAAIAAARAFGLF